MYPHGRKRLEPPKETWAIFDGHAYLARSLPHYVRARRRRSNLIVYAVIALCLGIALARVFFTPTPIGAFWIFAFMPVYLVESLFHIRFEHRVARQLREHDRLLCTHCGYPLRGSEAHGRCPECGTAYDHDSLRVAWTNLRWAFWKPRG